MHDAYVRHADFEVAQFGQFTQQLAGDKMKAAGALCQLDFVST